MTGATSQKSAWALWRRNLLVWAALLALLGLTLGLAFVQLGGLNIVVALGIAGLQVALLGLFFMDLLRSNALLRLAAVAGLFWLVILFALTLSDYLTRAGAV